MGDRIVTVIPYVGRRSDHYRISFTPTVTTREFSGAVSALNQSGVEYEPVSVMLEKTEKVPTLGEAEVEGLLTKVIAWARSADLDEGLAAYRALPTDCVGARPMRHVAALALAGDVEKLEGYLSSFKFGDRLGFVPYITEELLERAIKFAKAQRSCD
uniref:Uncharacterized protein n=1 Tax=Ralstonia syzygii R24 TaxID=907261 RepID=G3A9F3_9RALS|nr:conserved hypothetical protein [Ralstonia syzygii R24]